MEGSKIWLLETCFIGGGIQKSYNWSPMIKMEDCQDSSSEAPVFQTESLSFKFFYSLSLEPEIRANFSGSPSSFGYTSLQNIIKSCYGWNIGSNETMQTYEHSSSSGQTEFEKNKLLTVMHRCSTNLCPACSWAWKRVTCANKVLTGDGEGTCNSTGGRGKNSQGRNPRNTMLLAIVYRWKARND